MKTVPIAKLPNLGPKSAEMLGNVGIFTRQELETVGVVRAFSLVQQAGFTPSLNLLWAMEGALSDIPWEALPAAVKELLREELAKLGDGTCD